MLAEACTLSLSLSLSLLFFTCHIRFVLSQALLYLTIHLKKRYLWYLTLYSFITSEDDLAADPRRRPLTVGTPQRSCTRIVLVMCAQEAIAARAPPPVARFPNIVFFVLLSTLFWDGSLAFLLSKWSID